MAYVRLEMVFDNDCHERGGQLAVVSSTHPSRSIETQLERYFMDVRQGGRSVVVLIPGAKPVALGCTRVLADRVPQHWQAVSAIYLY